jgi:hypothetical protein
MAVARDRRKVFLLLQTCFNVFNGLKRENLEKNYFDFSDVNNKFNKMINKQEIRERWLGTEQIKKKIKNTNQNFTKCIGHLKVDF